MKTNYLLPHPFLKLGVILLLPFLLLSILSAHYHFELPFLVWEDFRAGTGMLSPADENFTNEIAGLGLLLSLIFIGFSRLKIEDEYIMKIRLESLLWGIYINYLLVAAAFLLVYGGDFLTVLVYHLYTPLIIYIIRFYLSLAKR